VLLLILLVDDKVTFCTSFPHTMYGCRGGSGVFFRFSFVFFFLPVFGFFVCISVSNSMLANSRFCRFEFCGWRCLREAEFELEQALQ